ncbi:MAG: hypothetical protein SPH68_00870 [Candidatus Borkfalkiaceae bacterium]|nr:hypothetical protein [Clostridia bacterium]MDY6222697.1 hypothetical protein [Christensenellaceae bacterium]
MNEFLICSCGIILCMIGVFFLRKRDKRILLSIDNGFVALYIVFFGVIFPINYVYASNYVKDNELILSIDTLDILIYYEVILIVLITVKSFFTMLCPQKEIFNFVPSSIDLGNNEKTFYNTGLIVFLIGIVSDFLYLKAYGGYFNYLKYSNAIRSGVITVQNPFSFLIAFRGCINISSYVFFAVYLNSRKGQRLFPLILFLGTCIYSMMILYSNKGRVAFAFYFLILLFIFLFSKKKVRFLTFKMFFHIILIILFFIIGLGLIGHILGRNSSNDLFSLIIEEISFVYNNFFRLIKTESVEYRYFIDCINWPIYLLPSSIWSTRLDIKTVSDLMTILSSGAVKGGIGASGSIVYGETPADLISVCYAQLGFLGVPFFALAWAWIGKQLLKFCSREMESKGAYIFYKVYATLYFFFNSILYGDPKHIIQSMFPFLVFIIIYHVMKPKQTYNKKVLFYNQKNS